MQKYLTLALSILSLLLATELHADTKKTIRIPQLSNDEVTVWTTVLYPNKEHVLKMHRHDHNRVIVALDSGVIKVVNNKGKEHFLKSDRTRKAGGLTVVSSPNGCRRLVQTNFKNYLSH
ncbi:MAG: hypothetical protein ACRCXC_13780 [Legionella sp.]